MRSIGRHQPERRCLHVIAARRVHQKIRPLDAALTVMSATCADDSRRISHAKSVSRGAVSVIVDRLVEGESPERGIKQSPHFVHGSRQR